MIEASAGALALSLLLLLTASLPGTTTTAAAASWVSGHTCVSDIPWSEFQKRLGFRLPPDYDKVRRVDMSGETDIIPAQWDWREHAGVTPVKDQGACGSCWAFASAGAFEGCALIDDKVVYDLSEQQLISCNTAGYGCNGGYFEGCFQVFHQPGAVSEECMPYMATDGVPCSQYSCEPVAVASDFIPLNETVESIKAAVLRYGPIVSAMSVYSNFQAYSGGCYDDTRHGDVNHAVVILGWDDNDCGGSWICKNSWSPNWGEYGFFRIRYGCCDIGTSASVFVHRPGNTIEIRPARLQTTTDGSQPFLFSAMVRSVSGIPLAQGSPRVYWRVNDSPWDSTLMTESAASSDVRIARIPAPPKPATIDYYFEGGDIEGHHGCAPRFVPDSCYTFDLARYFDDFEGSDDRGWSVGSKEDDATTGIWERVTPVGSSAQPGRDRSTFGTQCWVTGQQVEGQGPGYNDVDGGQTTLRSPAYDLEGARTAIVKYWRWFSNDKGTFPGEDPWIVQARNDHGPWVNLENTLASSSGWEPMRFDLKPIFGDAIGLVEFRFIAQDRGGSSCVEAAIDDFTILSEDRDASATPPGDADASAIATGGRGGGASVSKLTPNPTAGETEITFSLERDGPVDLAIYSAGGRLVRRLVSQTLARGDHAIIWNGRDEAGRPVASGAYYCATETAGERRQVRRLLVVR